MAGQTAGQLRLDDYQLKEVRIRLKEGEALYSTEPLSAPDQAAGVMAGLLAEMDRELCCVVNLDAKNRPINYNIVSMGTINESVVVQSNVFKSAILSNASYLMMFHNHPSGIPEPSSADYAVTERLIAAGRIMNIEVLDHIIIAGGTGERFSFRESTDLFDRQYSLQSVHEGKSSIHHRLAEKKQQYAILRKTGRENVGPKRTGKMEINL